MTPRPPAFLALAIGPNYNDTGVDAARAEATHQAVKAAVARAPRASEARPPVPCVVGWTR